MRTPLINLNGELGRVLQAIGRARHNVTWLWPGGVCSHYEAAGAIMQRPAVSRAIELGLVVDASGGTPANWQCVAWLSQRGMVAAELAARAAERTSPPAPSTIAMRDVMRRLEEVHRTARAADDHAVEKAIWGHRSTFLKEQVSA